MIIEQIEVMVYYSYTTGSGPDLQKHDGYTRVYVRNGISDEEIIKEITRYYFTYHPEYMNFEAWVPYNRDNHVSHFIEF